MAYSKMSSETDSAGWQAPLVAVLPTQLAPFYREVIILPVFLLFLSLHFWGIRRNRAVAAAWKRACVPVLEAEFAQVGIPAAGETDRLPIEEFSPTDFRTYATGRKNVSALNVKLVVQPRFNPILVWFNRATIAAGLAGPQIAAGNDYMEAVLEPFDGQEAEIAGTRTLTSTNQNAVGGAASKETSAYDGSIWAIVDRDAQQQYRDEQYDISLTKTQLEPRIPNDYMVVTEDRALTKLYLNDDLAAAVIASGSLLEILKISNQPEQQPETDAELSQPKRIVLRMQLPDFSSTVDADYAASFVPLFSAFIRLPDYLISLGPITADIRARMNVLRHKETVRLKKLFEMNEKEAQLQQLEESGSGKAVEKRSTAAAQAEARRKAERREARKQRKQGRIAIGLGGT